MHASTRLYNEHEYSLYLTSVMEDFLVQVVPVSLPLEILGLIY